jgi:hypothetical protein
VPREHSQHQYYSTTELGETKLSPQEVKALLERLAEQWPGGGYDLIHRNCCHFADAFAVDLGMGNIPRWVNRFARTVDRSGNLPRVALFKSVRIPNFSTQPTSASCGRGF